MSRRVAICLVLVAVSAGCSTETSVDAHLPAVASDSVEEMVIQPPEHGTEPAGLTTRGFKGTDGVLAGPYFSMRLYWVGTGPSITEAQAANLTQYKPRRAADGQELFAFTADSQFRNGHWALGDKPKPVTELDVAGKVTKLATLPLGSADDSTDNVVVIASVPRSAEVKLRITDQGRTQTLNVRTGKREADAIPGYYDRNFKLMALAKEVKGGAVKVQASTFPMSFFVTSSKGAKGAGSTTLAPYSPTRGWALDGRAWLLLPSLSVSAGSRQVNTPNITLDSVYPAVFRVRLPDGKVISALDGKHRHDTILGSSGKAGADVAFDVPADFTTGTYLIDLGGMTITAKYSNATYPGTWSPAPPVTETPITLS